MSTCMRDGLSTELPVVHTGFNEGDHTDHEARVAHMKATSPLRPTAIDGAVDLLVFNHPAEKWVERYIAFHVG